MVRQRDERRGVVLMRDCWHLKIGTEHTKRIIKKAGNEVAICDNSPAPWPTTKVMDQGQVGLILVIFVFLFLFYFKILKYTKMCNIYRRI